MQTSGPPFIHFSHFLKKNSGDGSDVTKKKQKSNPTKMIWKKVLVSQNSVLIWNSWICVALFSGFCKGTAMHHSAVHMRTPPSPRLGTLPLYFRAGASPLIRCRGVEKMLEGRYTHTVPKSARSPNVNSQYGCDCGFFSHSRTCFSNTIIKKSTSRRGQEVEVSTWWREDEWAVGPKSL